MTESIENLSQHDRCRTRDNKRVIVTYLAERLDEVLIWVTLEVVPQSSRCPVRSLRINIARID